MFNKVFSFILVSIILFNLGIVCVPVNAADSNANRQSFINFYSGSEDYATLNVENMSAQDFATLAVFISNYFEPGYTTLSQLVNESDMTASGTFFEYLCSNLNTLSNGEKKDEIKKIIMKIGENISSFFNDSGSTNGILYSKINGSKTYAGWTLLDRMGDFDLVNGTLPNYELYFTENGSEKVAINTSSPAFRASFQVLAAYNPSLFLDKEGIDSMVFLIVDHFGNIWGYKDSTVDDPESLTEGLMSFGFADFTKGNLDNIYLIMPACLNPATFSTGVKSINDLKFPMMNRFVLSCLLSANELNGPEGFHEKYIPFYNLFSTAAIKSKARTGMLSIFGVNTLTGTLFHESTIQTGGNVIAVDSKDEKAREVGRFLFNPNLITISKSSSSGGIPKYGSNSYIVLSPNVTELVGYSNGAQNNKSSHDNVVLDMSDFWASIGGNWNGNKFTIEKRVGNKKASQSSSLALQQGLIGYLFSPMLLNLNNVSMSLYLASAEAAQSSDMPLETLINSLYSEDSYQKTISESEDVIEAYEAAKMGMKGFSLFFDLEDEVFELDDGGKYFCVSADTQVFSKLADELYTSSSLAFQNNIAYDTIVAKKSLSSVDGIDKNSMAYKILNTFVEDKKLTLSQLPSEFFVIQGNNSPYIKENYTSNEIETDTLKDRVKVTINVRDSISMGSQAGGVVSNVTYNRLIAFSDAIMQNVTNSNITSDSTKSAEKISQGTYDMDVRGYEQFLLTQYAYSIFTPTSSITLNSSTGSKTITLCGSNVSLSPGIELADLNPNVLMGLYFGYMVDMCSFSITKTNFKFNSFNPQFLPHYSLPAKNDYTYDDSLLSDDDDGGVLSSDDTSFEQKQKDLINRIYGLTNDKSNDYRNSLIKSILDGFFLTVHRTITGTWGDSVSSVTTGTSSTYQSVTGYIYTPTLEELSFTATLMNNYIKIYIFCMIFILFFLVLMTILNMRTWQQSVLIAAIMFVAVLFPYLLISNAISIANSVSDSIYSDRFDFWAMMEHETSANSLRGLTTMSEKEQLLTISNATQKLNNGAATGVRIKWMSPKKVDMFQNLYSDQSMSDSFITNVQIFRWLFSSFIYDSEFVDTDEYSSYVYRAYTAIANEAKSYYRWGQYLDSEFNGTTSMTYDGNSFSVPMGMSESINELSFIDSGRDYLGTLAYYDKPFLNRENEYFAYSDERYKDLQSVRIENESTRNIALWEYFNVDVSKKIADVENIPNVRQLQNSMDSGIVSNLPYTTAETSFDSVDSSSRASEVAKAIFLKNTEGPYYYFYSILKSEYGSGNGGNFNRSLLKEDIFTVSWEEFENFETGRNAYGAVKDFLNMEGLFSGVIPYLKSANDYVFAWQKENGSTIETYNFEYKKNDIGEIEYNENGEPILVNTGEDSQSTEYQAAFALKNAMNNVWNMYSPWVDTLYDTGVIAKRVKVGTKNIVISDTLNPASYYEEGRPMIFSEADMIINGYNFSSLTDTERKIQNVLSQTYKDMMYLLNYFDLDEETLISAAAMYATFNFNTEFSKKSFFGQSYMLYPQNFELKNFNYDAFMRLALLNATGENIFNEDDLYDRVLSKTSIFTGIALLLCDIIACIAIPAVKFIIIVGLLFLGLLLCITLVINPPEKVFEAITKSTVIPAFLFMALNILFAWVMSLIIGEGLTAYVGSKTVNFATNDPTMTMLLMALLGVVYMYVAFKILKIIIASYKEFGLSTFLAGVGIVGTAFSKATTKAGKLAAGVTGGLIGGGIGMAMAKHDGRDVMEGAALGIKGNVRRRWQDKQMQANFGKGTAGSSKLTEKINALSGSNGNGAGAGKGGKNANGEGGTNPNASNGTNNTEKGKGKGKKNSKASKNIERAEKDAKNKEVGKPVDSHGGTVNTKGDGYSGKKVEEIDKKAKTNALGDLGVKAIQMQNSAKRKWDNVKTKVTNAGYVLRHSPDIAKKYTKKSLKAMRDMPRNVKNKMIDAKITAQSQMLAEKKRQDKLNIANQGENVLNTAILKGKVENEDVQDEFFERQLATINKKEKRLKAERRLEEYNIKSQVKAQERSKKYAKDADEMMEGLKGNK